MGKMELPLDKLSSGLAVLLEAYDWSRDSDFNPEQIAPEQFAVGIEQLRAAGMSDTHLIWLVCRKHANHLHEFTAPGDKVRTFRDLGMNLGPRSRFVLTDGGSEFARPICAKRKRRNGAPVGSRVLAIHQPSSSAQRPQWNAERRQLLFDNEVIMQLTGRHGNQELILQTFEEDNWPTRIDDPLPNRKAGDQKQRLRGAVEKLNARSLIPRIHFSCDGNEGICWSLWDARD
ncbi:MAG: hypothetical protein HY290_04020 [Planctomycetia bacterium]|nr:hypothetical protein [Planctomycetia bacterium]